MLKKIFVLILIAITLLTGCSNMASDSSASGDDSSMDVVLQPEDILNNAIEAGNNSDGHYARIEIVIYEEDEVAEGIIIQEWINLKDGKEKARVEYLSSEGDDLVTTSNGEEHIRYHTPSNTAFVYHIEDGTSFEYNTDALLDATHNKYIVKVLEFLKTTESIENLGIEEIDGLEAYHIKGDVVGGDGVTRALEVWIDKEEWRTIKIIPLNIGNRAEYKIIDYRESPEIDEDLFTQKMDGNAKIIEE